MVFLASNFQMIFLWLLSSFKFCVSSFALVSNKSIFDQEFLCTDEPSTITLKYKNIIIITPFVVPCVI